MAVGCREAGRSVIIVLGARTSVLGGLGWPNSVSCAPCDLGLMYMGPDARNMPVSFGPARRGLSRLHRTTGRSSGLGSRVTEWRGCLRCHYLPTSSLQPGHTSN